MSSPCGSSDALFGFLLQSLKLKSGDACDCSDESTQLLRDYATREFNALLWVALIASTAILLHMLFKLFALWFKARRIPGLPCPSFYGHRNLVTRQQLIEILSESHERYGPVVKLWLGPSQLLVSVKDTSLIKEMLLKAEDKLPLTGKAFDLAFGGSSLFVSSYDEKVQKRRESLVLELNVLARENSTPVKVVDSIMERINHIMRKGSIGSELVSQHMAFTLLGATFFGDTFLSWSKASFYEELLVMVAKDACFWASYRVTPLWKQGFWRYQAWCTKVKCLTQDIVQQCRRNYKLLCHIDQPAYGETTKIGSETASVPSCSGVVMPEYFFSQKLGSHQNAIERPCGNIMGVMFHGGLAMASLISSILVRLVTEPKLQDKIYSEIMMARKMVVEKNLSVDKLVLLLATVYESARLLPAGTLLQRWSPRDDLSLKNGVTIPAGAVLVAPVQLMQTDDSSWGTDASEFNPYRFLSKTGKFSDSVEDEPSTDPRHNLFNLNDPNDNEAFLPFGSGKRSCVGQKFVIQGVARLFASLLELYEIRLPPAETKPKPTIKDSVVESLPSPELIFVKRMI
ncbi:cytokinin hydroxylase-like isoform X1 [Tripterygium wilfordii]|uniref:Cytochrome P450 727B20 n=1 Tax=Tripterygium wilfordii TaxID=458696 RepID=A0A8T8L918_TRIWF|nr:cytokinin hydroxylase-like isoform X1 [Tripterygium wilfordii]QUN00519.1 cytochrome P450 727B20 [Tripterygium wilfordii]